MPTVLTINTTFSRGGAAKVARDLFIGISQVPGYSTRFAFGRGTPVANDRTFKFGSLLETAVHGLLVRFGGIEGFGTYWATKRLMRFIERESIDLIHVHNLHGYYLDWGALVPFLGKRGISVVWTLHDEWALTWMPAYANGCAHCMTGMGCCTNTYRYPRAFHRLFAGWMLRRKQRVLGSEWKPYIVTPARWLADEVGESYLAHFPRKVIVNGINTDIFRPLVSVDRRRWRLPVGKRLLLFAASDLSDSRKGARTIQFIVDALAEDDAIHIVTVGKNSPSGAHVTALGYLSSPEEMASLLNVVDLFAFPSISEVMPLQLLEAMACGARVIGYDIQANRDVELWRWGACVSPFDQEGFLAEVRHILRDSESGNPANMICHVQSAYGIQKCIAETVALYDELLGHSTDRPLLRTP